VQADTPEGMEYGIEDGEIIADELEEEAELSEYEGQDGEYDLVAAGNMEVILLLVITCNIRLTWKV